MSYINGRNTLLYTIAGIGIVFFLTIDSTFYCTPDKSDKTKITEYHLKDRAESLSNLTAVHSKYHLNNTDIEKQKEINKIVKYIGDSMPLSLFDDNSNNIERQVVNGDGTSPQPTHNTHIPIYDTPRRSHSIHTGKAQEHTYDVPKRSHSVPRYNSDGIPPQSTTSVYDIPKPIYDEPKHGYWVSDGMLPQATAPVCIEGVNNDNIPQTTSKSNDNLHSSQVKAINKRSIPHDSEDDFNQNDKLEDDLSSLYAEIASLNSEDAGDLLLNTLNDSSDKHSSNQNTDDDSSNHDYAEIPDTVDVWAESHDSNDEYSSHNDPIHEAMAAPYNSEVKLRVDRKDLYRTYFDDDETYEEMDVQHNSEDAVNVPAKLGDDISNHEYAEIRDTFDVQAESNDSNDEYNSNQAENDNDKNETDLDTPDGTTAHIKSGSDDNTHSQDTNNVTTSVINADNNSENSNDDKAWDDNKPNNNMIAAENNQLSNTYNQKKAIAHGDHGIFSHLFNSANYTALHRISSRLTAYALDQTVDAQFISQKLVSSGSNISNVQHEIWIMPLIKKEEKYVDSVSKYTIGTYGINIGFDSKIPHCNGNIESVLGIACALYNSQLKYTASDSATLLNTYIISLYYSMIFNQKFFIYTLFSFGTSNAGNYHSATGVNNTPIYNTEPCSSYNAFRQSAELHAGYNIMVYDSKLHDRQIVLMPMAGVQIDTVALHSDTKKHYSSAQQLKLSTGIKFVHHKRINPSISINSSLYGFVNYCAWSNTMTHNDQSLISNFENGTLVEKDNLVASNNKLYYRIGGDASLQYNRVMYSLRYEMKIAQDYLSHQIALKMKLKF